MMTSRYVALLQQSKGIPISVILDHFNVKYDRSFNYLISCPIPAHIHQSGTPSFKVYKDTNSFYCFGCKRAGGPAQLTMHMLGVKTIEEALDYLAQHFNLKTHSLAKTFLNITNKIKSKDAVVEPRVYALSFIKRFSDIVSQIRNLQLIASEDLIRREKIITLFEQLCYYHVFYVNNILDRGSFESKCNLLLEETINFYHECQQKEFVIDAENLSESPIK